MLFSLYGCIRESLGVQLALEACQGNEERPFTSTSTSITRKRAFEESTIILRSFHLFLR